ncbi:MAG: undecaprenyldiphospho-muramoylpentapeptide beta-N-acetylglucosaminyltransferase [Elusimicrobia bacterium RIFOXYA2_FULL_50_26]|nr:MAG: undecaprenyldiphospho-muramoylpentapeptide beta-N-acetylglucosaminyltransferase [Elusimicrobia bacterium RIFOXYA2_FULL_50_26]OGS24731.1 MAG: undecaprenyldiphospho-muramoylpentapeptide beta-N-acetylglucosaminyltransferase [Elusimicrobia bacterium RIFOXYB2_FULL_50_12]
MPELKTIIIAAGGTGGHLYPGIALARELARRNFTPVFIVRENDPAQDILAREQFAFRAIPVRGMPRKISFRFAGFIYFLFKGLFATARVLGELKPEAVVGMGGYISFPAVFIARLMGMRTLIHEQNYIPGLSNRILSHFCGTVAVSFEQSASFFSRRKTIVTGNPVRADLFNAQPREAYAFFGLDPAKCTVLVFGGSLGASALNTAIVSTLPELADAKDKLQFIHLAGKRDADTVAAAYKAAGIRAAVRAYLHEIGLAYSAADLVICRAGATTVTELSFLKKKAVLVPYPHATADHQHFNASLLVQSGQAVEIRENALTPALLASRIVAAAETFATHTAPPPPPPALPQSRLADAVSASLAF